MATQLEPAIQPDSHSELAKLMEFPPASAPETQPLPARPLASAMVFPQAARAFRSELELPLTV